MRRGGELHGAHIAWESWGELNAARDNAILLFTGLSPSAHAASSHEDPTPGWWEQIVGPGKAIDTDRFFVVCVNSLGSCFGSTGPASIEPKSGTPWRLRFPDLAVEDIAAAGHATAQALGLAHVHAVVGPSLGGMVVLAFVALFPGFARRVVCISGTDAASPVAIALRSVQREAITHDPEWLGGNYAADKPPRSGMRLARKIGTITYRSAAEWIDRFGRAPVDPRLIDVPAGTPFAPEFAIEGYLEAQAERFVHAFDPNCYLYISRAMDRFDLAEHGGTSRATFARAGLEAALVMGVESDFLFAIGEQARVATALADAGVPTTFARLDSREGHDAFLVDVASFDPPLRKFLG
jgi:homoserine O-acetyltransferase